MIDLKNKLRNVISYKINNTKNKIIAFVNCNYKNHFKILDIGLTNGLILLGYTNNCFIPSQLNKLYYNPTEKINCIYSELIEKTNEYILFNSYFLYNKKIVGFMKNIKCINITKNNNNLYKLKTINIIFVKN